MWKNWKHEVTLNDMLASCLNSANYNYTKLKDSALFSDFKTPYNEEKPFKREPFFQQLMLECGEFEVLFPQQEFFLSRVHAWTKNRIMYWQRIYDVLCEDYEPLENYNRHDEEMTHDAIDAEHKVDTDTNSDTLTEVASYDSGALVNQDEIFSSGEMGEQGTNNSVENFSRNNHSWGNIGVTTSQQMVLQEIEVAQVSMQEIIISEFKDTFCLGVY